jgi:hypothetical protein
MAKASFLGLRFAMIGTFAVVTAVASLVLMAILTWLGIPFLGIYGILGFVIFFHVLQWLIGPYLIEAVYKVKPVSPAEHSWLMKAFEMVRGKPHEFCVELIEDVWVLVCYAFQDQQWHKYILGPYTEFEDLLEYYKITPEKSSLNQKQPKIN